VEATSPVPKRRIPTELDARKLATEHLAETRNLIHPFLGPLKMQMPNRGQEDLVVVEAPSPVLKPRSPVLKRRIPTELDARKVATEQLAEQIRINRHLMHPFLGPTMLPQSLKVLL
jgi:hypothetical protein